MAGKPPGGARADRARRWSARSEETFFEALADTGNVRAAAGRCGFSAGTVYALRRARPDFAERWAKVLAGVPRRPSGSILRYARGGHVKRIRCHSQWSEEAEDLFLDVLAATCNVSLAAEEAGVGHTSVYRQRRLRPDFARKWQAVLEQSYDRLDMALIEAANACVAGEDERGDRPLRAMSVDQAIRLLQLHRASATGAGRRPGWKGGPTRGFDHYRDSIARKIEAIRKARRDGGGGGDDGERG
ncbi:MAG TPA: hypothetical protein VGB57_01905 [Allosphingosinicella sp.]